MELTIAIESLEERRGGSELLLGVKICGGGNFEERKLAVASGMLSEIGYIGHGNLPYALTNEQFDMLEYFERLWQAVKKGLDLLSYVDNTKASLITKLRARGFDKYTAEDAAEYLAQHGYIDERRILERAVEQLANVKLFGKSRIKTELYKKGISRDIIAECLDGLLCEIDFEENLTRLVEKRCDFDRLSDRRYRESFYASMYRLGYSPSQTRDAINAVMEDEDE